MLKFAAAAAAVALVLSTPAAAQITFDDSPPAPAAVGKDGKDPNRIVCERHEEIGSRLGAKKVCKSAAQWDEERRQQRDTLEGVQRQGTSTGTPSGGI
jgi:hypothetical protein